MRRAKDLKCFFFARVFARDIIHILFSALISSPFFNSKVLIKLTLLNLLCLSVFAQERLSIVWSSETENDSNNVLRNIDGNALSSGAVGNGDGDLVVLGYFSEGSTSNPFLGEWTALTQNTRIGDSSSGYGFPDGFFTFQTLFTQNSSQVTNYWGEPKVFTDVLEFQISSVTPPTGTPICIRFYNSPTIGGALYNTVTGAQWTWPSFSNSSNIPQNLFLKISSDAQPSSSTWKHGAIFQDPLNSFKTTISESYSVGVSLHPNSSAVGSWNDVNGTDYKWGDQVILSATPGEHTYFIKWHGTEISNPYNPNTTVEIKDDCQILAEFAPIPYFVDLYATEGGTVSGQNFYSFNDNATITAGPNWGYRFSHWSWENNSSLFSEDQEVAIVVSGDFALVANFEPMEFSVSIETGEGGTFEVFDINGSPANQFFYNSQYSLIVSQNEHYLFNGWSGDISSLTNSEQLNSLLNHFEVKGDITLLGVFEPLNYKLNILASPSNGYSALNPPSGYYYPHFLLPVSTTTAEGYEFLYWQDPHNLLVDPFSQSTEANMSGAAFLNEPSITALFRPLKYEKNLDINITAGLGGSVELDSIDFFEHFQSYDINATPRNRLFF